jgi:A/G-specific adenine glycosylase
MTKKKTTVNKKKEVKKEEETTEEDDTITTTHDYKLQTEQIECITSHVLQWYDSNHRELPWRANPINTHTNKQNNIPVDLDVNQRAYNVWISEIMSQQTRIATVIDYYAKWMKQFPTVQSLAESDLETVHQVWSGLGYYRRADNIHKAAKKVVNELNGVFPKTVKKLQELPGVGRYTAGAIASIVFNERAPVVDGNVLRVLSRIQKISLDISKQKHCNEHFWPLAEQLVSHNNVPVTRMGDLNQALMEMGAVVCTPKNPECENCCLKNVCQAYKSVQTGEVASVELWPVKAKKKEKAKRTIAVCVAVRSSGTDNEEYYIMKNPTQGLLANLYQFPSVAITDETTRKEAKVLLEKYLRNHTTLNLDDASALEMKFCGEVQHIFSHIDMQLHVYTTKIDHSSDLATHDEISAAFATEAGFDEYGIPTVVRKVLKQYQQYLKNPFAPTTSSQPTPKSKKKKATKSSSTPKKRKKVETDSESEESCAPDIPAKRPRTRSQSKLTSFFKQSS